VATPHHQCSISQKIDNVNYFDTSIGCSIVRWDLLNKKKIFQKQLHESVVTFIKKSPKYDYVITLSYHGELKAWDLEWGDFSSKVLNLNTNNQKSGCFSKVFINS
jgi:WD40 repeat protein